MYGQKKPFGHFATYQDCKIFILLCQPYTKNLILIKIKFKIISKNIVFD